VAGAVVELCDVVAAGGDHQAVAVGARPVVDQRGAGGGRGVGDGDLAAVTVGARPAFHLPVAERLEGVAVPGVVLAADLVQLVGRQRSARAWKAPPAWISGSWRSSPTSTSFAPASSAARARRPGHGADHPGLIDDQHPSPRQPGPVIQAGGELGDRH
jgi:hypothetical protein